MFKYPVARRDDHVQDNYFGYIIKDPYRWLEDPDSKETVKYVDAQNAITRPYLDKCPARQAIKSRITQIWDYPKYSCPYRHGRRYFFYKNDGLQNQFVMYMQEALDAEPQVFLDANLLSPDGTIALTRTRFSEDGNILAYGLSSSGSDWISIHFKDVATTNDYPEVLKNVKFSAMTWTHDNAGIFYCRYPTQKGKADGSETDTNENQKLYYHRLGTQQKEDVLCAEFPQQPKWRIGAEVTDCGRWVIVMPQEDCRANMIYVCDLWNLPGRRITGILPLRPVIDRMEADYEYITNEATEFIFRTNMGAPNYQLIKINIINPNPRTWKALVPGHPRDVLDWATPVCQNKLVICYIHDVKSVLQLHDLNTGQHLKTFPLDVGTIVGYSGRKIHSEMFYQFTSYLTPGIIYHCDLTKPNLEPTVFREIRLHNLNPKDYEVQQLFYYTTDGTVIPMFVTFKKGFKMDGSRPCLMYGYGGFNVSILPVFSVSRLVFMQHFRGVVAIPNIRGGGEYGEAWHNAGRMGRKQNVFDDFHAAAQFLVNQGYTNHKKLVIQGGSNGGLLVAACINQRPELYGAAICQVGVLDMLRFHKFTIGHAWTSDYGCSDVDWQFEFLIRYSPLHNIQPPNEYREQYPATMLMTADHDDRVVPLHSLKFIATLQEAIRGNQRQTNPLMIRVETKAGHGGGKPTTKLIDEVTDIYCFIVQALHLGFHN